MAENTQNASVDTSRPITPSSRDESMDIMSLLKNAEPSDEPAPKKKSAIELAKEQKENSSKGLVVSTKELEEKNAPKQLATSKTEADAFAEMDAYSQELENLTEAAKKVVVTESPKTPLEMAALMDKIEDVSKHGDVVAPPAEADPTDQKSYIRMKTSEEMEAYPDAAITEDKPVLPNTPPAEDGTGESPEDDEKKRIVQVIIDKTGLGSDVIFTDEEKEKLFSSTEIRLKEVEDVELSTLTIRKPDKSFVEEAKEYQFSSSQTMMSFPASRFRAEMSGLTYGELGDISLNNDAGNVTFDQIRKKLTVIYNKMKNPSCGPFASFDDFLKKFAYVDMDLAVYGLVISTFPEVDDIPLTCNNPSCKKSFNHKFSPRSLLNLNNCDMHLLKEVDRIIHATPQELEHLIEDSPTQKYKVIKLPISGFIVKLGIASAYDYLYTIVDNTLGDKFETEHPDDVNGILQLNSLLLGLIRAVLIPNGDGSYTEYDKFEDMIHALYMIKPGEIRILTSVLQKFINAYTIPFELSGIVCPHCGAKTPHLEIDINYLVFLKYQRLMNEELNIDNITVL